jgi:hypothetical protein
MKLHRRYVQEDSYPLHEEAYAVSLKRYVYVCIFNYTTCFDLNGASSGV